MSQVTATISLETLKQLDELAADAKKSRNDVAGELLGTATAEAHRKLAAKAKPAAKKEG